MGQRVKRISVLPSCGTWAGVYSVAVQTGGELRARYCQGMPVMSAEAEHAAEAGREDFLSAVPALHLTPDRGLCWAAVGCNQGDALPELLPGSHSSPLFLICFSFADVLYHVHNLELKLPETSRR